MWGRARPTSKRAHRIALVLFAIEDGEVVLALELAELMAAEGISKAELARRMETGRSSLERLLASENDAVTLATLRKAARPVGRRVELRLVGCLTTETASERL